MKICFYALREFDELCFCEEFKEKYGIDFAYTTEYPSEKNIPLATGCDGISTTPCDLSAGVLEAFSRVGVRYILCRSIGYDHVDLKMAKELGMKVDNVSYPPTGVAGYAVMLMLACVRRLPHILKRSELQDYTLNHKLGRDLSACTVGVLGTGKIGTAVVRLLSGFGCRLLAYDLYENETVKKYADYAPLDAVLAESDVITLHMNANDDNYHLIDRNAIAKMKRGAYIINTARGKLVDSGALIEGIESGKLGGAALDVLEFEDGLYYHDHMGRPMSNRDLAILRSFPNVIVTPHTAFYTEENVGTMLEGNFKSLADFESGAKATGLEG